MNTHYFKSAFILLLVLLLQATSMTLKAQQSNTLEHANFKGTELSEKEGILSKITTVKKDVINNSPAPFYSNSFVDKKHGIQNYSDVYGKSSSYEYHEHNNMGVNIPLSAHTDASGNTFITGAASNQNSPEGNYVAIKLDTNGAQLWETILPGTPYAVEMGIVSGLDSAGNFITSGTHWNGTDLDVKIVKFDATTGAVLWQSVFDNGSDGLDIPTAIHIDNSGNTIVTGITYEGGSIRYLTLVYNASGNLLWSATDTSTPTGTWNEPTAVTVDSSGNVYITGYGVLPNPGQTGLWHGYKTIKYDTAGNELWQETYVFERLIDETDPNSGMTFTDSVAQSIAVDNLGNCYITGTFDFWGSSRIGTIKYDSTGNEEWVETYIAGPNNTNLTNGHDIKFVNNNTIYVGGRHRSGWVDEGIVLLSYDDNGNRNWEEENHSSIQVAASKLIIDTNNLPVIAGLGYDDGTFDQRVGVFRYSDQGNILKEISYLKPQSDFEGIMGLVHLGLDTADNAYLVLNNFYSATGYVFETVKMHMDSGHNNTSWEETYSNLFGSSTQMLFSTSDADDNTYVTGRHGQVINNVYIGSLILTKYDPQGLIEWEKTFNEQNNNDADGIVVKVNSQGEVIVFLIPKVFEASHVARVKKYNSAGSLVWETEKDVHNALLRAFFLDDNDNIYIAGSSKENASDPFPKFTLMKFSDSGAELWTDFQTTNDPNDFVFEINSGTVNSMGEIILTGTSGYSTMFSDEVDLTVLKYTNSGNLVWMNKYPQTNYISSGFDVITDLSNNIYVTGAQQQTTILTEDVLVLKIDDDGDEQWTTSYAQTNRLLRPYKIMQDSNGDLITPSYSLYWVPGQSPNNRITTIKLNKNNGNIEWVNNTDIDRYYADAYIDADDDVFILNQAQSTSLPYHLDGRIEAALTKIAPNGTSSEEIFAAPELSWFFPSSIEPLNNGTLLLGGDVGNSGFFNGFYFFESSHSPLSIQDFEDIGNTNADWLGQNYPNPVINTTEIPFYLITNERIILKLYDSQGRFIRDITNSYFPKGMNAVQIDRSGLTPGVYFYQIVAGNYKYARKMIVK